MGGNIFKEADRFSEEESWLVADWVEEFLCIDCGVDTEDWGFVEAYRTKESFGDMDVVIDSWYSTDRIENFFIYKYGMPVQRNGKILSVCAPALKGKRVQIDFIFEDDVRMALDYYNWNDLGNLIGRQAHKLGFKFGHDGLSYVFREGTNTYATHRISNNITTILDFLKFDSHTYHQGFHTLEDIFEFVASGVYFNPDIYLLHNLNNTSRTRDRKRKTYQEFLLWCKSQKWKSEDILDQDARPVFPYIDSPEWKETFKADQLERSFRFFGWESDYNAIIAEHEEKKQKREWWNGDIAHEVTGLEGKDLGIFMQQMKGAYDLDKAFQFKLDSSRMAKFLFDTIRRDYDW